jgi:hypothetical protein
LPASIGSHRMLRPSDRQAGDCYPLASRGLSLVLAMEVAISRWQAKGAARNSPIDPRYEPRQSAVGIESMANSSSSASKLARPRSPSTWQGAGNPHRKGGRRSSAIMPMGSPRWISLSFRHSHFDCFTACSFYLTAGVKSYGWA